MQNTPQELLDSVEYLVRYLARSFSNRIKGTSIDYEDLISEGNVAVWEQMSNYSPSQHGPFANYISPYLRSAMGHVVRHEKTGKRIVATRYEMPHNSSSTTEQRLEVLAALDHPTIDPMGKVIPREQIAEKIGYSRGTVENIEHGTIDALRKLCA